jgi:predicted RNA methylase
MDLTSLDRNDIITKRGYRKDIQGDAFSLYISNYPVTSQYLAVRLGNPSHVLLELCCSIGVTLEYLSPAFKKVIGVEIDTGIAENCRNNLRSAGLLNTEIVCGDVNEISLLKNISADIVIYDIPYWNEIEERNSKFKNPPLFELLDKIKACVSDKIVVFAPPKMDQTHFRDNGADYEFEKVYINNRHDRNHIYYGSLIVQKGEGELRLVN